jgi:hypothetical protein
MTATSYATVADVQRELSKEETDTRALARIQSALDVTTERLTHELRFDFFRHPSGDEYEEGDEVRLFDTSGSLIHAHTGIVSVTLIRVRWDRFTDWTDLLTTDYDLEAWAGADRAQSVATTDPFDHIRLNGTGFYSTFPRGRRLVEITGVFGWPAIPLIAVEANVDWARQSIAADRTYPGGIEGVGEDGRPMVPARAPEIVGRVKQWSLERFSCAT